MNIAINWNEYKILDMADGQKKKKNIIKTRPTNNKER